ncbi:hypothetical protein SNEBB_004100 [Seison nebaliae]|nr:hypothetical protein SNEBB_004100 [Seison nebaliae]
MEAVRNNEGRTIEKEINQLRSLLIEKTKQALILDSTNSSKNECILLYRQAQRIGDELRRKLKESEATGNSQTFDNIRRECERTEKNVEERLSELSKKQPIKPKPPRPIPPPPKLQTNEEASKLYENDIIFHENEKYIETDDIMLIKDNLPKETPANSKMENAKLVLSLKDSFEYFSINEVGIVETKSSNEPLNVFIFEQKEPNDLIGFIQIDNRILIPLHDPPKFPTLQTAYCAYMFPENAKTTESIGIIFNEKCPKENIEKFQSILERFTQFQSDTVQVDNSTHFPKEMTKTEPSTVVSSTIGKTIDQGSQMAVKGINIGKEWLENSVIPKIGTTLRKPAPRREHNDIGDHPSTSQRGSLQDVRYGTYVAARVSSNLVDKLGDVTRKLAANYGVPLIDKGFEKVVGKENSEKHKDKFEKTKDATRKGIEAYGTIWNNLETSGKNLANAMITETVNVVNYHYGEGAGKKTENILHTAGNVLLTGYNISCLGPKALAKRTAKSVAKEYVVHKTKEPEPQ